VPEPEDLHAKAGKAGECEGNGDQRQGRLKPDPTDSWR
jgi:hypothetical protein